MHQRVIIVGAGSHARVIASLLASMSDIEVAGVADRTDCNFGEMIGKYSIIATFDHLSEWLEKGITGAALALGNNNDRADMFFKMKAMGFHILTLIHPAALIERDVQMGEGVVVCAGAILCTQVKVGDNVLINTGAIIDHECVIASHAHIGPGSRLAGRVNIGEKTFVGIGATVKEKIVIGARSVIGAGSVVVRPIPDDVIAYGVPAIVQR